MDVPLNAGRSIEIILRAIPAVPIPMLAALYALLVILIASPLLAQAYRRNLVRRRLARREAGEEVVVRVEEHNPLAPWHIVGHCPQCGKPYFVSERDVYADARPHVRRTCRCSSSPQKKEQGGGSHAGIS